MFSVIIPLYNKKQYVSRSIESVFNQSFTDFEIIVVDDGSTDGGGELVLNQFDNRIQYIKQEKKGVSVARNTGIASAKNRYIAFLDADDYWHPQFLFWMKEVIEKYEDVGMVGSTYTLEKLEDSIQEPEIWEMDDYFSKAIYNTRFTGSSTIIRKDFFENNEGFKSHLTKGEDVDVWFRAVSWFKTVYYVNLPLMFYDIKASSSSAVNYHLKRTVFCEMVASGYLPKSKDSWDPFKMKYLLLNNWLFFHSFENFEIGKSLIMDHVRGHFLMRVVYHFPFNFWRLVMNWPYGKSLLRSYFKFCVRYIYT